MLDRIMVALRAQAPIERIADPDESRRTYAHWRLRTMYAMIVGYAAFYLVRKNMAMATPALREEFGLSATSIGLILSLHSIIYGVGKFLNGMVADRANPRYFMAIGLLGAALVNVCFGLVSSVVFFAIFWAINAWSQSMGWPPCARMLAHWYSPSERGTMWGFWNSSHQIGGATISILAGYLVATSGWRSAFFVPAAIAVVAALFVANRLRDTPQSMGLPPVEVYRGEREESDNPPPVNQRSVKEILLTEVLSNKYIWYVCLANVFVYIVRAGMMDWGPTFLKEAKHSAIEHAGWQVAGLEIAGIAGAIACGFMSDRVFRGRRGPAAVIWMVALIGCLLALWQVPPGHPWIDGAVMMGIGFTVYGPQMLVGVAALDFVSKDAAGTATGLTGTFGYVGSALAGVGTGLIADHWGWNGGFLFFAAAAVIGTFFFILIWNARAESAH